MYNKGFHFEIKDLITQFIAAMDDVVISRYNKLREEKEQIKVRYVHAPKERVIYDIVNKSQNITVPVISVSVTSIQRDESRVFNKIEGFYSPIKRNIHGQSTAHIPMPNAINLGISMSILTNYQSDMDQILSNFVPYANPYIIISWRIPDDFGVELIQEIRSEVLWDGTISLEYPVEVGGTDKPRFVATTNFTIKGWLFPAAPADLNKNIFFIDSNFHITDKFIRDYDSFTSLSAEQDHYVTETISYSGTPLLTNLFLQTSGGLVELSGTDVIIPNKLYPTSFLIYGENLQYTRHVMLSSDSPTIYKYLSSFDFTYYPSVTAFDIPNNYLNILNENMLSVALPPLTGNGNINFIVVNQIGWQDTNKINSKMVYLSS